MPAGTLAAGPDAENIHQIRAFVDGAFGPVRPAALAGY
jgi:hypothetical protein